MMAWTIAWRELRSLFLTPIGWVVLGGMQLGEALIFYRLVEVYQANPVTHGDTPGATYNIVSLFLAATAYVALLIVPLITMRSFSEERRQRSLALVFSAPVSDLALVVGKYLGVVAFLLLALTLLALMPLSLGFAGTLDPGLMATAWLGTALLVCSYAALGVWASSLTEHPALAAALSVAVLLAFWLLETGVHTGFARLDATLAYLSVFSHYSPMLRGLLDSADVAYYLLFIAAFLGLGVFQLQRTRARN